MHPSLKITTPKTSEPIAWGSEAPLVTPYTAKMHEVPVCWRVRNTDKIVIGPDPKLVLAVRARRPVELLLLRVDYLELGNHDRAGAAVEAVLVQVPHVVGQRKLKPDLGMEPWVWGQENIEAKSMFQSDRPEDLATEPSEIRWYGGTIDCLQYNRCPAPNIWWVWRGRIEIPKGLSVGIIARCDVATVCKARMSGV